MTVLSGQMIRCLKLLYPLLERKQHPESGCSYGLSACGYDIRLDQDVIIPPGGFSLASTIEKFHMPNDIVGIVHDKSTWARRGIAVQNTVIEPGWSGFLTLEISDNNPLVQFACREPLKLVRGTPIAQVIFHFLDQPAEQPYPKDGKYQDQARGPQEARDGTGFK